MKKIFLLVLVFLSLQGLGQIYKVPQSLGSDSTLVTSKGGLKGRIINWPYTDTTQANTQAIKSYPGAQIFTTNDNLFWLRNSTATAWINTSDSIVTVTSFTKNITLDSSILLLSNGTRYAVKDSIGIAGITVTSFTKNATRDSAILLLSDGTRYAVKDTAGVTNIATGYGLSGGPITTTGTLIADTATLSTKYLRIVDTTGKWVTSVYRKIASDTVFYVKNGVPTFAFRDSIGTGAGGVTVTSFAKNFTRDSAILTLSDLTRFAVKDSLGIPFDPTNPFDPITDTIDYIAEFVIVPDLLDSGKLKRMFFRQPIYVDTAYATTDTTLHFKRGVIEWDVLFTRDTLYTSLQQATDRTIALGDDPYINNHGGDFYIDSSTFTAFAWDGLYKGILHSDAQQSQLNNSYNFPLNSNSQATFTTQVSDTAIVRAQARAAIKNYLGQTISNGIEVFPTYTQFNGGNNAVNTVRTKILFKNIDTLATTPAMMLVMNGDSVVKYPFSGGGGGAIDTTNKWVNNVTKNASGDSFYIWKGAGYTALKDSAGGGGASQSLNFPPIIPTPVPAVQIDNGKHNGLGFTYFFADKSIGIIYREGVGHFGDPGVLKYRTSTDYGYSYSAAVTIDSSIYDLRNAAGGVTRTGRLIAFYARQDTTTSVIIDYGYRYSDDKGVTWSAYTTVAVGVDGSPYGGMIEVGNGVLVQSFYKLVSGTYSVYIKKSTDNGATWGADISVISSSSSEYSEGSFIYLSGPAILGVVRNDNATTYKQVLSVDNGATWTTQGDVTFETHASNTSRQVWLSSYQDNKGKLIIVCYYPSVSDQKVHAVYGYSTDLISGVAGWNLSSIVDIGTFAAGSAFFYGSIIHPYNNSAGIGFYYDEITSTNSVINFVTTTGSTIVSDGSLYTFSTGLNETGGVVTNNLSTGVSGGQTAIGGTGVTDILNLQGTTGNGTGTSPAVKIITGNNGNFDALTVLNNGSVGIGTNSPDHKFHIVGQAGISGEIANFQSLNAGNNSYVKFTSSADVGYFGIVGGGMFMQALNNKNISFYDDASERMTIQDGGNVGIGITTPSKIFHTVGTVRHASLGTATADTSTYKPMGISSAGDVFPMTYWPGGGGGGGGGSVTSVATGYGLSGGTITTTGTIIVDTAALSLKYARLNALGAYAPIASPTFTGTVTIPTPFTLGATSVTTTGTQLNYLNAATGTTGTASTNLVYSTSPTLVTPTLGVASATTINKVALTAPATGSTLTIADGKTLTASNSITLAGTDGTTMTFPKVSSNIAAQPKFAIVTGGDFTTTSATAADITGLSVAVDTSKTYRVTATLWTGMGAAGGGIRFAINGPSGTTVRSGTWTGSGSTFNVTNNVRVAALGVLSNSAANFNRVVNTNGSVTLVAYVTTSTTAGNITIQAASGTATETSTIYASSAMDVTQLQ